MNPKCYRSVILPVLGGGSHPDESGHISPVTWAMDAYTELIFVGGSLAMVLALVVVLLGDGGGVLYRGRSAVQVRMRVAVSIQLSAVDDRQARRLLACTEPWVASFLARKRFFLE